MNVQARAGVETGYAAFGPDRRLVEANAPMRDLAPVAGALDLGAAEEEALDALLGAFDSLDGISPVTPALRREALARWGDPSRQMEGRLRAGGWRLLSSFARPDGGRCFLSLDITARKARAALAEILIEEHPMPVFANDGDTGRVIYVNPAGRRIFKVGLDGLEDAHVTDFLVDASDNRALDAQLRRDGRVDSFSVLARAHDGSEMWVTGAGRAMEHDGRRIVLSSIFDITDMKVREQEVVRAREMLADAFQSLTEGFALYDEESRLVMCNDRYREMNGAAAHVIRPGMSWETLMRENARLGVYKDALGREAEWVRARLESGVQFIQDFVLEETNGRVSTVSVHPTSLGGFVVTRTDITERVQAERSRAEADALLAKVLDSCPATIMMSRIGDGEIIYRTPAARRLFGETRSTRDHFVDPTERADYLTALLPSGRVDEYRIDAVNAKGEVFPAVVSARVIDYKGEDVIVSTTVDMSEMYAARDALARLNERLRDAIEALDEGFALFDAEERLVMTNRRYLDDNAAIAEVLVPGASNHDILSATVKRGTIRDAEAWFDDYLQEREGGLVGSRRRYEFQLAGGEWRTASRSPTREGGFVITWLDINEQKRAEAAQRDADAVMRRVLEACPVALVMSRVDDGEILYRSDRVAEMFGDFDNVQGYWPDEDGRRRFVAALRQQGRVDDMEGTLRRRDGPPVRVALSGRLVDFRGEPAIVSHAYDLTERIAMEEEIAKQREILHQSEKLSALGELLAGVAHELNNPLSIVVGHALMLKEEATDPAMARRIDKISGAAERCARIVKTFLSMARQRPARIERVGANALVETALEVAGYAVRASGVEIELRLDPEAPDVLADADQITQVFTNLIVNAEHALAKDGGGEPRLMISSRHDPQTGDVVFKFQDNGPGIPEAIRARIFEPFFTTKEVGEGTGIGLAFCHRIVETHGGRIYVKSSPGRGAVFYVRLPAAAPAAAEAAPAPAPAPAAPPRCALVVDDEPDIGDLIGEILRADGYRVDRAASGEEAMARILRCDYDLVLTDLNMPGLDGRGLLEQIRGRRPGLERRLGFITGDTMSPGAEAFLEQTGRPYLEKPVSPGELRALARRLAAERWRDGTEGEGDLR